MSRPGALPVPTDPADDRRAAARGLIEGQVAMLTRLAEVGMAIVEDAGRRSAALAAGAEPRAGETDPGLTYSRAARAVRLTLALQTRLLEALDAWGCAQGAARVVAVHERRARIHRLVERAILADHDGGDHDDSDEDGDEIERLCAEARERLQDDEDEFGDLLDRPVAEVVARICRDLGLSPHAWTDPAIAGFDGGDLEPWPRPGPAHDDARPRADLCAHLGAARPRGSPPPRPPPSSA